MLRIASTFMFVVRRSDQPHSTNEAEMSKSNETKFKEPANQDEPTHGSSSSIRGLLIAMGLGLAVIALLVGVELSRRP